MLAALCPDWSRYIWDGGVGGDGRLSVLHLLADEHLPLLEEYLAGALAAPDGDEELQRAVRAQHTQHALHCNAGPHHALPATPWQGGDSLRLWASRRLKWRLSQNPACHVMPSLL